MTPYKDPEDQRQYYRTRDKRRRQEAVTLVAELKSVPCADCGQTFHPVCMDFHHEGQKDSLVSDLARRGRTRARILRETEGCVVLCACCHRLRHLSPK